MATEEELLLRQMPHSVEAEQSVLGAMLIDARCVPDVIEELKNLDVGNMTPIDALNTIYRLQNKLKNRWR